MSTHGALYSDFVLGRGAMRVTVKDCLDIAGMPTHGGSRALADALPATDHAAVVGALLGADCTIVGKANMHELAYGVTGINAWTGSPINPLFPDRVPGGSSSGSAVAVAEGIVDFAIGTDTGGSIRTPAACCGVFGLKPTFGRVSREGAWPRRSTLDCIGPFARSMALIETAMAIIAPGYAPVPDFAPRYALVQAADIDPEVQAAFDDAMAGFAAPTSEHALESLVPACEANMAVIAAETHAAFGHLTGRGLLGADVEARLCAAASVTPERLSWAEAVRERFGREVDALLRNRHALIMPTLPCLPIAVADAGDSAAALGMTRLVRPFNLSGHPALTVPVRGAQGPIGIQIIGRRGHDETVCALGRMLARALGDKVVTAGKEEEQS